MLFAQIIPINIQLAHRHVELLLLSAKGLYMRIARAAINLRGNPREHLRVESELVEIVEGLFVHLELELEERVRQPLGARGSGSLELDEVQHAGQHRLALQ